MASVRAPEGERKVIGKRLRELRKKQGKTTMEVAISLGVTQGAVEGYEQGKSSIRAENLRSLAAAIGVTPHELHDALYPVEDEEPTSFRGWAGTLKQLVTAGPSMSFVSNA